MSDTAESDRSLGRTQYMQYPQPERGEDPGSRVTRLVEWAKNCVDYLAIYRMRKWVFCRMADLFFDGDQWCTADRLGYVGVELASYYQPDTLYLGIDMPPRPVLNEYKDVILNEQSRLDRSDYEPTVRAMGSSPGYRERNGAKVATRALRASLEEDNWEHKKRLVAYHLPSYGGAWIESEWEVSLEDTVRVPVDGVRSCPTCSAKYAPLPAARPGMPPAVDPTNCTKCLTHDEEQPPDALTVAARAAQLPVDGEVPHDQLQAPLTVTMPGGPPLQPYIPRGEDLNATDVNGLPLGEDVPIGNPRYTVHSYSDVFEENMGIGADGTMEVRGYTTVRVKSLDWIRARYARARTSELRPESAMALQKYHTVSAGEWMESDDLIYRNHARVFRRVEWPWVEERRDQLDARGEPTYRLNRGKVVTVCGGLVLQDEDLMVDGPPDANGNVTQFPRILGTYTPHDIGSGGQERLGSSLSRQLIDPQRWVNMSALMDMDEQRNGQSRWLANSAVDIAYDNKGEAGSIARYTVPDSGADNPSVYKPELVSRTTSDMKYGQSAEYARGYMGRVGRLTETEAGTIDPNAPASAMQIAREESGEVRKPRVEAIAKTYQKLYRHRLQLMQKYVKEPRVAWDKQDSGTEFQSWYTGADFAGQTDVVIDVEGAADTELLKQKKLDEAIGTGVVDMTNPVNLRIIGKLKGLPSDLTQAEDVQEQAAEREYLDFAGDLDPDSAQGLVFGEPPTVDDGLDNHAIHVMRHEKDLHSDTWHEVEKAVGWSNILKCISGWKMRILQAMVPPPPEIPQPVAGMPPAPLPPPAPPNIDLLRPTPQLAIVATWVQMIEEVNNPQPPANGQPPAPPSPIAGLVDPSNPAVLSALSFRAHHAEHKLRLALGGMNAPAPQAPAAAAPPPAQ